MLDPVSAAASFCGHLLIVLDEGVMFSSCKTTCSDIGQGYGVGAGPLRGSGINLLAVFLLHQRETLEPGGSLRVQWVVLAFLSRK